MEPPESLPVPYSLAAAKGENRVYMRVLGAGLFGWASISWGAGTNVENGSGTCDGNGGNGLAGRPQDRADSTVQGRIRARKGTGGRARQERCRSPFDEPLVSRSAHYLTAQQFVTIPCPSQIDIRNFLG
jgi:hypothetical protein